MEFFHPGDEFVFLSYKIMRLIDLKKDFKKYDFNHV